MDNPSEKQFTESEIVARREAALKTMFATPHKPHKASKKGGKESSQSE
jgi:hypothetical protein